jgi:hypothetical protein
MSVYRSALTFELLSFPFPLASFSFPFSFLFFFVPSFPFSLLLLLGFCFDSNSRELFQVAFSFGLLDFCLEYFALRLCLSRLSAPNHP